MSLALTPRLIEEFHADRLFSRGYRPRVSGRVPRSLEITTISWALHFCRREFFRAEFGILVLILLLIPERYVIRYGLGEGLSEGLRLAFHPLKRRLNVLNS